MKTAAFFLLLILHLHVSGQQTARELGIQTGVMPVGETNSIIDVKGVKVGHTTLIAGDSVRTGVTAVLPHGGNLFKQKVPAAIFVGNGFGKLVGTTQIMELGAIETPVILTNTLNVGTAMDAVINYTLGIPGNEKVLSVNPVVGETNDGYLNDIRGQHVLQKHVLQAISQAKAALPEQGNVGAGTGTVCFGYKGGIGTSSRKLPQSLGGYTIGVLVQTNFGGILDIGGVNIGEKMGNFSFSNELLNNVDGSCMIIVATDAPLGSRNLERLAKRSFMGLAQSGGIASNGSGDYVIAFSTAKNVRVSSNPGSLYKTATVPNNAMSPLFMAVNEATEEAIINSLFMAETMTGYKGHTIKKIPVEKVLSLIRTQQP